MPTLTAALTAVVGDEHVLTDATATVGYRTDWTGRFSGPAHCVVRPADTGEVAAVMRHCAAAGQPVVVQGGNTGLVGGSVPRGGEVVVSLCRLDRLDPVDAAAGTVVAGAGVTLAALQRHADDAGLAFGVDLAARDSATVGGMVATNAGGVQVLRHGPMRAQVRGVEAVLADGRVLRRLAGPAKDSTGYDLPGLLVGSEGTLAAVTAATLRLVPRPRHRVTALLACDSVADATRVLADLRARLSSLDACELMFAEGVALVCDHAGLPPPFATAPACVVLADCADATDPTEALAAVVADADEVTDTAVATDRPGRERLWAYRERHSEAVAGIGLARKLDVAVPVSALPAFADAVAPTVAGLAADARVVRWGHLAEGNLHVNIVHADPADVATADAVDAAILRLVADHGGSIAAEHGVGVAKARWLGLTRDEVDIAAMRALKAALDPHGRLNPGVLFAEVGPNA